MIFGATGDLMHKKLVSSLFHLYREKHLPALFQVVGFAKDDLSNEAFREMVGGIAQEKVQGVSLEQVAEFTRFFVYQQGLFEKKEGYGKMASFLGHQDNSWKLCSNKLFYIAASPQLYETIFRQLASSALTEPCSPEEGWTPLEAAKNNQDSLVEPVRDESGAPLTGWTRVIVEKPFGKDLKTAQKLDKLLGKLFREEQIYRIDHYLGKETVQNILAFRFSNSFLDPTWDAQSIESMHITLLEKEGIGDRGGFYEGIGALRDVGQNHILQLLALFTMENPNTFDADSVRRQRANILQSLKILSPQEVKETTIRGQYEGYRKEKGVDAKSQTETYFRIKTFLNTPRWKGVPIYLESGKAMAEDRVEVIITFRHTTPCLCPPDEKKHYQNVLHYRIQPKEGIHISFWVKKPGPDMVLEEKDFSFDYKEAFGGQEISEAYDRLLLSVIRGDQTLFVSTEEIMAEWKFVDPIVRAWQENATPLKFYKKHSFDVTKGALPADT